MQILPLLSVTFSAAFSQPRIEFDTTVSFRMFTRDSIYIRPIRTYLYYGMSMTASCPAWGYGEFMDSWDPPGGLEKIPSEADILIRYTTPCGEYPLGGADTTFSFDDRQYKVRTPSGDVYMMVTGITHAFEVSLKISSDPFPLSLPSRSGGGIRRPLAGRARKNFQSMRFRNPKNNALHLTDGRRSRDG